MTEPIWISLELALAIHHRQIAEHGGGEGTRDEGLLASAIARPRHILAYSAESADIADLAAAYAFGIAKNHPFVDGNKRTAAVVCETFLELNGRHLTANDEAMYTTFMKLAAGSLGEDELAMWIRSHIE